MNKPSCPVCSSINTTFFCKKEQHVYFSCRNCITLFLYPFPSSEDIHSLYEGDYGYRVDEKTEKRLRNNAKRILKTLHYVHPQGKTLLDIGSGFGFFLEEALRAGFQAMGLEPAKNLFAYSQKKLASAVVNQTYNKYFAENPQKTFDYISLIHVIEHLPHPLETIRKLSKHLNKNGILYIETPNLDSWLFRAEQKNYTFLTPPDHLFLFSKTAFTNMLAAIPSVSVLQISSHSYPEHFMGIAKKMLKKQIAPPSKTIASKSSCPKDQKNLKYLFFDALLSPFFTPLLNIGIYGSILELYIKKK